MQQRDGYIPGVPCWVDTSQPDPVAAVDFYRDLFGWEFENVLPPEAGSGYHIARIEGGDVAAVTGQPEGAPPTATWNTYIWVDSADETVAKVLASGGRVLAEPFDVGEAGRMAVFADPEGAVLSVWQAARHRGAQIVNQPGSVNFNGLHTRDPESASEFYGAVFGWKPLDVADGMQAWRLPGYGDFLAQTDPGIYDRMEEGGAPEGFADVVATLNPIADDDADTPAHWSVTFSVADADATAARAFELGGRVVVPPFDAPWVRMTVISDPQGATLIASRFTPENRDLAARAAGARVA